MPTQGLENAQEVDYSASLMEQGSYQLVRQLTEEASQLLLSATASTPSVSDSLVSSAVLEMLRTGSTVQAAAAHLWAEASGESNPPVLAASAPQLHTVYLADAAAAAQLPGMSSTAQQTLEGLEVRQMHVGRVDWMCMAACCSLLLACFQAAPGQRFSIATADRRLQSACAPICLDICRAAQHRHAICLQYGRLPMASQRCRQ